MLGKNISASAFPRKLFYRAVLACLLALTLFSAALGGGITPALASVDSGTIAYVRDVSATGDEIRLVEPDGSNDRLLWRTNTPLNGLQQIFSLAWRPDATELAFASRHEDACSLYSSDIYTLHADGAGYRRVTAGPTCGNRAGLPTGNVVLSIQNYTDETGPFLVYFEGAPGPQSVTVAPGDAATVAFTTVADYGSFKQWGVVIFGQYRFMSAYANADVLPGKTVTAGSSIPMTFAYTNWGWTSPSWNSDGSQISYIFNGQTPYSIPSSVTAPGMIGLLLFNVPIGSYPSSQRFLAWAPPGPRANQVLYIAWASDFNTYIYLGTSGSTSYGDALVNVDPDDWGNYPLGLAWLPDSSGFLYSKTEGFGHNANISEYSFATGTSTRITNFTSGFPRQMSVSPDGTQVVFEYQATGEWSDYAYSLDLYMMDRNGNASLFVEDARAPAWSPADIPMPVPQDHFTFIPAVIKP